MAHEKKEFKITCQGCDKVRFIPFVEFKPLTSSEKAKSGTGDILTTIGLGAACIPLGCCSAAASLDGAEARKRTPEQNLEKYFEYQKVQVCKNCGSSAKKVEVITHKLDNLDI